MIPHNTGNHVWVLKNKKRKADLLYTSSPEDQQCETLSHEFSFYKIGCLTKAKESNLPFYLTISGERRDGFMPFLRVIASETDVASSRI